MERKVAVIAGGAGRIGFEICRTFCESGMPLVILGSSKARAINTARKLEKYGGQCLAIGCNIVNSEDVHEAMEQTVDRFGGIDVVVSMQGWPPQKQEVMDITDEYWNGVISSHLTGSFHMLQQAIPYLEKSTSPRVIFLASYGGLRGDAEEGLAYSAAKGGIVSLTYSAAKMLACKGITVNCIATGGIYNVYVTGNDIGLAKQIPLDNCSILKTICKTVSYLIDEAGGAISGEVFFYNSSKITPE
ncbi:MAG: SDR family oxidoreductase [Anaerolineaceae bacterium]|nr:SDR family oxidoreductase [Anaerolineaceae bacterium]